jgi:hypothetical protein
MTGRRAGAGARVGIAVKLAPVPLAPGGRIQLERAVGVGRPLVWPPRL